MEENNLHVHVSALRKVLGAAGSDQRCILTVAGRGYRFVAPLDGESSALDEASGRPSSAQGEAAASAAAPASHNLPQQPTALIGREADLEEITARLKTHRRVMLTGSGGVGKTRLAIEAGAGVLADYPDGVWLAELAPLGDAQLVTAIVAGALGITSAARQPRSRPWKRRSKASNCC